LTGFTHFAILKFEEIGERSDQHTKQEKKALVVCASLERVKWFLLLR
jgi:hypothetical protein